MSQVKTEPVIWIRAVDPLKLRAANLSISSPRCDLRGEDLTNSNFSTWSFDRLWLQYSYIFDLVMLCWLKITYYLVDLYPNLILALCSRTSSWKLLYGQNWNYINAAGIGFAHVLGSALACKTELMHFEVSEVGSFICLVSKKPV